MKFKEKLTKEVKEFYSNVYENFVDKDLDVWKKWAKPFIYPAWLLRTSVTYTIASVFLPIYLLLVMA